MSALSIAIEIVLAIVFIIILYIITLVVLNIDTIVVNSSSKVKHEEMIKVIDGYAPINQLTNRSYNTVMSQSSYFKKIAKSLNSMGGAQFTYQFWIKIDDPNDDLFKNLVLLVKGDKRKYNLGYYEDGKKLMHKVESEHAIGCPLIKFNNSYRNLKVRINTIKNPLVDIDITMNTANSLGRQNLLSLLALNSWYMFTFVFSDSFSIPQAAEDGIKFVMYVNDVPYIEQNASTMPELKGNALKQNDGDLHIFPDNMNSGEFMKLGNLNYYNYALNADQVIKQFEAGPPGYPAMALHDKNAQPSYITAYNKIDLYNF